MLLRYVGSRNAEVKGTEASAAPATLERHRRAVVLHAREGYRRTCVRKLEREAIYARSLTNLVPREREYPGKEVARSRDRRSKERGTVRCLARAYFL